MLELPYAFINNTFKCATNEKSGQIFGGLDFNTIGDIRIMGMYTGLSEDMSTGLLAGAKFPSGSWTYPHANRDTQIGSGSADLLLGAYHLGTFPPPLERCL